MLNAPLNINGRSNADVVRPVASAVDLVQRDRGMWTIDFGFMEEAEAAEYELPFEYVREHVLPVREKGQRAVYRTKWWQYARPRLDMRRAVNGLARFVVTPGVSKHRIFIWGEPRTLYNQGTLVFARDDDYFFGVLHSRLHELWALRQGTWLGVGNDARYTPTTTFETFPFPWPPGHEPPDDPRVQAIAEAARALNEKREAWLNPPDATEAELKKRTLTNLYNERPTWLALAHEKLDRAVLGAYGWPDELSAEAILERLLALNVERAGSEL
jgi:type II restriction/modification system DNA methylase subunit YeeA